MKRVISIISLGFSIFFCCFIFGCYKDNTQPPIESTNENDTYLNDKINKINEIRQSNTITKQFFFITDLHWTSNSKKSPALIKAISSETNINNIVFCGDYIGTGYAKRWSAERK